MHFSRPVLPSQRYSPTSDYGYESQHELIPTTRQPLGESTGNVQAHSLTASALCYQNQLSLSPPIHAIPTPPILPTQALTSSYGTSLRGGRSLQRNVSLPESQMGYSRGSQNPIYAYKHFADYRNKVMQKELEKEQPIWPLWLEDAFLDALLLIPQMGRKKFSSKTILYGRNMLITEYLWIYHWLLHPPREGERIPDRKQRDKGPNREAHPMYRTRKQVSSHIQVLKGFFQTLVTFHFIFPSKKDAKEEDKKLMKEDEDTESFKNNRVLISIADGRLPDERPNYEYFARLLSADNDVFLRPKQCWIFVSSSKVSLREKHVTTEEGTTKKQVTGYTADRRCLEEADYPHLKLNDSKDYKDLPRTGERPTVLLHEYTRALSQKESSSVKDISNKWDVRFPDLKEKLVAALDDTRPSDERTSRCVVGPCDTFHFEVVLDLHSTSMFPDGTELNGMVELSINRPDLHNHSWRSITSVVKPEELYMSEEEPEFWERANPVEVAVSHRVGCNGVGPCDCAGRGSRDTICVPFPAHSWASTFIKLAPYVTAERERVSRERAAREAGSLRGGRAEREAARLKKESDDTSSSHHSKKPTPKELLSQVAMYQEVWSAPNDGMPTEGSSSKRWTRRAVILWTFEPVREHTDDKGKTVTVPPGTNWRFLTKFDPTSQYHQQHAYLSGSPTVIPRDSVMSPNPGYAHHVDAAMHEHMSAAYDVSMSGPPFMGGIPSTLPSQMPSLPTQQPQRLGDLNVLIDGYHQNGLATPPPTAALHPSYPHSFDDSGAGDDSLHHIGFMPDGTSGPETTQAPLVGAGGGGGLVAHHHPHLQQHHHHHHHHHNNNNNGGGGSASDSFLSDLSVPVSTYDDPSATLAGFRNWGWLDEPGTGTVTTSAATTPGIPTTTAAAGYVPHAGLAWGPGPCSESGTSPSITTTTTTATNATTSLSMESQWAAAMASTTGGGVPHPHPHPHPHHSPYDPRGSISAASSSGWTDSEAPAAPQDAAAWATWPGNDNEFSPAPVLLAPHPPHPHQGQVLGRKRSRDESLDGDDDADREGGERGYSVRKLAHGCRPSGSGAGRSASGAGAPTAVMERCAAQQQQQQQQQQQGGGFTCDKLT
ncbi:hypothetical protein F4809DRAFT_268262 [Biscogniauxia mediterranea]|nr:hypothetical protein F4809DRAFT_268262 [Biscogniauxia mediterranea]